MPADVGQPRSAGRRETQEANRRAGGRWRVQDAPPPRGRARTAPTKAKGAGEQGEGGECRTHHRLEGGLGQPPRRRQAVQVRQFAFPLRLRGCLCVRRPRRLRDELTQRGAVGVAHEAVEHHAAGHVPPLRRPTPAARTRQSGPALGRRRWTMHVYKSVAGLMYQLDR
jgi:hypothetical protein